jgi:hypothetical protein
MTSLGKQQVVPPSKCFGSPGSYDADLAASARRYNEVVSSTSARERYAEWNADHQNTREKPMQDREVATKIMIKP